MIFYMILRKANKGMLSKCEIVNKNDFVILDFTLFGEIITLFFRDSVKYISESGGYGLILHR